MIISEYLMWLVPLGFYVFDCFVLLADDELLIEENYRLKLYPRYSASPFTWKGKNLYLLPILNPFASAVKLKWFLDDTDKDPGADPKRELKAAFSGNGAFRVIAIITFLNFFLIGPIFTYAFGLVLTIQVVLSLHLFALALTSYFYVPKNGSHKTYIVNLFEFALCPGYLANIVRRQLNERQGALSCSLSDLDQVLTAGDMEYLRHQVALRQEVD